MAKKKAAKAATPGPMEVRVLVDAADDANTIYANYAEATAARSGLSGTPIRKHI